MYLSGHTCLFIIRSALILCLPYMGALSDDVCGNSSIHVEILREKTKTCYYKHTSEATFEGAREGCNRTNATLTSVLDGEEWNFIVKQIQKCDDQCGKTEQYWLGLYQYRDPLSGSLAERRKGWTWLDGSKANWSINWKEDEPSGGDRCARLDDKQKISGRECDKEFRYICKKPFLDASTTKPRDTTTGTGGFGSDRSTAPPGDGAPVGVYAGAGVGAFVVITIIVVLVVILKRCRKRNRKEDEESNTARTDPVYCNDLDKPRDKCSEENSNYENCPQNTGYREIKMSKENGIGHSELHPGHASYAEVGQFDRTVEYNLMYDTGRAKDTTSGNKDGQYDLPVIKEVSAGAESSGRTAGNRKPAPKPKPSFLRKLARKKPSISRNDQGGEETGKSHGGNKKKKSRRSIRDLYAAVDFTKKRNKVQQ